MNIKRAKNFESAILRKLSSEKIDTGNHEAAIAALSGCVMGTQLIKAYQCLYSPKIPEGRELVHTHKLDEEADIKVYKAEGLYKWEMEVVGEPIAGGSDGSDSAKESLNAGLRYLGFQVEEIAVGKD